MARTRRRHALMFCRISFADRQRFLPILPILVLQKNRNRRADSRAVAHARQDMNLVGLNFHAAAAAVALLPPPQVAIEECLIHLQSGWQAGEEGD